MLSPARGESSCFSEKSTLNTALVVDVDDHAVLHLSDERRVLLHGILLPHSFDRPRKTQSSKINTVALSALKLLVEGARIKFRDVQEPDRRGRQQAHLWIVDSQAVWVQGTLIDQGHARVSGEKGSCAQLLLQRENTARRARLGLWANPNYRIHRASNPGPLYKRAHSFQIITGTVLDVAKTKSATYLNFGPNWRTDVTAALRLRSYDAHALIGKAVRVRGWLRLRNGPLIDVESANQIEVLSQ
ncbi:MAG: thermonuclease family protein [Hyphomicrobiales bacterium]